MQEVYKLGIEVLSLQKYAPEIAQMQLNDVHISDMLGWYFLANEGGIVADMDILFYKPIPYKLYQDIDIGLVSYDRYNDKDILPIGFLIGKPNEFWKALYETSKQICGESYQCIGIELLRRTVKNIDNLKKEYPHLNSVNIGIDSVYPYVDVNMDWDTYIKAFYEKDMSDIMPEDCFGIHWYGGNKHSMKLNMELTESNYKDYKNNTIVEFIKEVLK